MPKSERSKVMYIEPADDGKPCASLAELAGEFFDDIRSPQRYVGLTSRPGKNRRRICVTVTVEAVA